MARYAAVFRLRPERKGAGLGASGGGAARSSATGTPSTFATASNIAIVTFSEPRSTRPTYERSISAARASLSWESPCADLSRRMFQPMIDRASMRSAADRIGGPLIDGLRIPYYGLIGSVEFRSTALSGRTSMALRAQIVVDGRSGVTARAMKRIGLPIAVLLATAGAAAASDCAKMPSGLPRADELAPDPVFYKTGGKGWSFGHRLADPATGIAMAKEDRDTIGFADVVFGMPVNDGRDVKLFWNDGAWGLCGLKRPLLVPIERIRQLLGPTEPSVTELAPPAAQAEEDHEAREEQAPPDTADQERAADLLTPQQRRTVEQTAAGVAAFESTAKDCFYEPAVAPAIRDIDERYGDQFGSYWTSLKRQTGSMTNVLGSLGPLMQPEGVVRQRRAQGQTPTPVLDRCKAAGLAIPFALMGTIGVSGFKPDVFAASQRLMKGGGRSR